MVREVVTDDDLVDATYLRQTLKSAGRDEALKFAAERLRERGIPGPELTAALIHVLESPSRQPGRPKKDFTDWLRIWAEFRLLREKGNSYEASIQALADEHGKSNRSIESIVARGNKGFGELRRRALRLWKHGGRNNWPGATDAAARKHLSEVVAAFRDEYARELLIAEGSVSSTGEPVHIVYPALTEEEKAEILRKCPHGCTGGCKRPELLEGRRKCALFWG